MDAEAVIVRELVRHEAPTAVMFAVIWYKLFRIEARIDTIGSRKRKGRQAALAAAGLIAMQQLVLTFGGRQDMPERLAFDHGLTNSIGSFRGQTRQVNAAR